MRFECEEEERCVKPRLSRAADTRVMPRRRTPDARVRGFTLIELMIAMAIVTFGLLVILGLFTKTMLMEQRTEVDLVTDVAYSNAIHAIETPGFNPGTAPGGLGNTDSTSTTPGNEFAYASAGAEGTPNYAISVIFKETGVTQWFTQRPVYDAVHPLPAGALPGQGGLEFVTIHTGRVDKVGDYSGIPNDGEVLNDEVLIGMDSDEGSN